MLSSPADASKHCCYSVFAEEGKSAAKKMPPESGGWTYPRAACGSLKSSVRRLLFALVYTSCLMHASKFETSFGPRSSRLTDPGQRGISCTDATWEPGLSYGVSVCQRRRCALAR